MSKTPETEELIRDVNPKSRNVDYWILKHQRAVDFARSLELERNRLREILHKVELDCSGTIGNLAGATTEGRSAKHALERIGKRAHVALSKEAQ